MQAYDQVVQIPAQGAVLEGRLVLPAGAIGMVAFAHGSGSSRHSPRNNYVAGVLQQARIGTLLIDLLTPQEDTEYANRFDIELLTTRLLAALNWLRQAPQSKAYTPALFGASTGAAAALKAAAALGTGIAAVVSRGGRPDLAANDCLRQVQAPTLLIVGARDELVLSLNEAAYAELQCEKSLRIIPGATHLFEEPGTLEQAARIASDWLAERLLRQNPASGD